MIRSYSFYIHIRVIVFGYLIIHCVNYTCPHYSHKTHE